MSEKNKQETGSIQWVDLTVADAPIVRDFYEEVTGWTHGDCDMGGYCDYFMTAPGSGKTVAGVCHARGVNAGLPPVWLIYINVANLDDSMTRCRDLGGQVLAGPKGMGGQGRYCVIQDPAGAVAALFEPAAK